jgi:hypothetical protein
MELCEQLRLIKLAEIEAKRDQIVLTMAADAKTLKDLEA